MCSVCSVHCMQTADHIVEMMVVHLLETEKRQWQIIEDRFIIAYDVEMKVKLLSQYECNYVCAQCVYFVNSFSVSLYLTLQYAPRIIATSCLAMHHLSQSLFHSHSFSLVLSTCERIRLIKTFADEMKSIER